MGRARGVPVPAPGVVHLQQASLRLERFRGWSRRGGRARLLTSRSAPRLGRSLSLPTWPLYETRMCSSRRRISWPAKPLAASFRPAGVLLQEVGRSLQENLMPAGAKLDRRVVGDLQPFRVQVAHLSVFVG